MITRLVFEEPVLIHKRQQRVVRAGLLAPPVFVAPHARFVAMRGLIQLGRYRLEQLLMPGLDLEMGQYGRHASTVARRTEARIRGARADQTGAHMQDELAGKVAVVTGAASGIGRALAERFAAEGMSVVLADVEPAALAEVDAAVRAAGAATLVQQVDVRSFDAVAALAAATVATFGRVDIVCNNAGVAGHVVTTWEATAAEWDWVLGVNITGVVNGIRAFMPIMLEQNAGHVVNTASIAGLGAIPYLAAYTASKHAVVGLSESLYKELEARGSAVRVSVLCPGFVRTKIMASERNWDASLGDEVAHSPDDQVAPFISAFMSSGVEGGVEPSVAAEAVVAGLLSGQYFLTTNEHQALQTVTRRSSLVIGHKP
jgi:NAD(P)-dependent dehydrogenase (short-subunit alcohol dehydrogenase family)